MRSVIDLEVKVARLERSLEEMAELHDDLHLRVEALRGLRVVVYSDRELGSHSCWSGELNDWLGLEPFVCAGCYQMVSPNFVSAVLTYTIAKRNPQFIPWGGKR